MQEQTTPLLFAALAGSVEENTKHEPETSPPKPQSIAYIKE